MIQVLMGLCLAVGQHGDSAQVVAAKNTSAPETTAFGASVGWSSSGISLRHFWKPRLATDLALYTTFGDRFGIHSASLQMLYAFWRSPDLRVYAFSPLRWVYLREPTEYEANFGPDIAVRQVGKLRVGAGVGVEVRVKPHVALAFELPAVVQFAWISVRNEAEDDIGTVRVFPSPNMALYVYFR